MTILVTLVICVLAGPSPVSAQGAPKPNKTYDDVLRGMSCRQQQGGQMDCEYKVGRSLLFVITGVGQPDVSVSFFKVDFETDYYAGVTLLHGCVVVKPSQMLDTLAQHAFVSPQSGRVFREWQSCHKSNKR